jgi:hypothetical protein
MSSLLLKILLGILSKLVTEKFFSEMFIMAGYKLAQSTSTKLDDAIIQSCAEKLEVKYPPF